MRLCLLFNLILFCGSLSLAQEKEALTEYSVDRSQQEVEFTFLEVGPYYPISINNNFISESDFNLGFEVSSSITYKKSFLLGLGYNQFALGNHDITRLGNIEKSRNRAIYLSLGYKYHIINRFTISCNYEFGLSTYTHDLFDSPENFNDDAIYNNLRFKLSFALNNNWNINYSTGYRIDILDIDVPREIESLYKTAQYLNMSLSISYSLK